MCRRRAGRCRHLRKRALTLLCGQCRQALPVVVAPLGEDAGGVDVGGADVGGGDEGGGDEDGGDEDVCPDGDENLAVGDGDEDGL